MGKEINAGLIGFGTIGRGVARLMLERSGEFMQKKGFALKLKRIADLDVAAPRGLDLPKEMLTTDAQAVLNDPEIEVVIELIGGLEPARTFVLRALEQGKSVVTANKALLAQFGDELFRAAREHGGELAFEASVCGGIPILRVLRQGLFTDRIVSLYGILNGTTNYILTKMAEEGGRFEEVLRQAQDAGFAEADPTMDVSGKDAAQKLAILLRIGFGASVTPEAMFVEGIERIGRQDIEDAEELGYAIKLLAISKRTERGIEARVHPAMIPKGALLASIRDEFNAVELVGDWVGPQVFYGRGAGERPTANAVVSDLVELAERRLEGGGSRAGELLSEAGKTTLVPMEEVVLPYYVRMLALDQPGVLGQIAELLSEEGISIASVIQKGRAQFQGAVPVVIMTHEATEAGMRRAIQRIDALSVVRDRTQVIRVEEL
ncbi:MAG: homoserine dehydrogenase [Candidatus Latescibacteria bacterium 4484_107]|nr:MAG: homoserine dehydrogenase [Candidatus Latescibacteria bacterium 4484_107]